MSRYLVVAAATAVSIALMWAGETIFAAARAQSTPTFDIPLGLISWGDAMFLLSGAVFAVVFMAGEKRKSRFGHLIPTAIALVVIVVLPLSWYTGAFSLPSWLRWIASPYIQGAAAFGLGGIISSMIWGAAAGPDLEEAS